MKKLGIMTAVFALAIFLSITAQAATIDLSGGGGNFYVTGVENLIDANNDGEINVGDIFYGIIDVQNITPVGGGPNIWNQDNTDDGTLDTLSGFFYTKVTNVTFEGSDWHIDLGPVEAPDAWGVLDAGDVASDTVMKLFKDDTSVGGPGTPFIKNSGTVAGDIAAATDGAVWATLGTGSNGYWYTHGPIVPVNVENARSWFGLDFIINNTGFTFLSVDDPDETHLPGQPLPVEMFGDSHINTNTGTEAGTYWGFTFQDPATVVTPEPGTLLLLGSGLLGGALLRRRRARKS